MNILVVEDNFKLANFIQKGLTAENHSVDVAHEGKKGLELALKGKYDLVVLDLMLPDMDGLDLIRTLKAEGVKTPVLVLTAKDAVEDRVKGLDLGADDYMVKPFAFAELSARVRSVTRRSEGAGAGPLRLGKLELDPAAHKVTLDGEEIEMTAKEFSLLEYFMRNPNQVLTRSMIAKDVWDEGFEIYSNVIDVYVNFLRNKIEGKKGPKYIHTIRGRGYMMRKPE